MGSEEEEEQRGLEKMGSSVREVEGVKVGMERKRMGEGKMCPQQLAFFRLLVCLS